MNKKVRLPMIVGPTASGKTALSIHVAKKLCGEIISADSMQIYRELNICSAKPTKEEMQGIPHYMLSIESVTSRSFNVAEYKKMTDGFINEIILRDKIPIVVGGTGLYINALSYPLSFTSVEPNCDLRESLALLEKDNPGSLYKLLRDCDPKAAQRLHPNDTKRIIRALEVFEASGRPISDYGGDFVNGEARECDYDPIMLGITMPRELLYSRIEQRVDIMLKNGLLDEIKVLYDMKLDRSLPAVKALGCKQLFDYFDGNCTIDDAIELIKMESRRYAKRQITWFKRDTRIRWFDVTQYAANEDFFSDAAAYIERAYYENSRQTE
ncbi:MAG: tRNA (adenosine(37)-N6)-dimethylallyltransferase MiaA [Clostridia bacterium]|nr:tRNA (adenosine(37)-N6)-dimethylallyltransferase MiaA [Clostridia bacterium]